MRRTAAMIAAALLIAAGLAACGKKGDPAPPDPDQNVYPRTYPKSW